MFFMKIYVFGLVHFRLARSNVPTYVALLWIAGLMCIVADMFPKRAEQVAARKPDCLSEAKKVNNVALECLATPAGNEKCEKRYPRVRWLFPYGLVMNQ